MRTWHGFLTALAMVALAGTAAAQTPALGVFFDAAATQTTATYEGGPTNMYTAYICAVNCEQTVGGVAFRLVKDSRIQILNAVYPAGVQIGSLTDGIQVGFTDCYNGFFGAPVLIATLTLYTGTSSFNDGDLDIVGYPRSGEVELANCLGEMTYIAGLSSSLTITPQPQVGIYFDLAATNAHATFNGGVDVFHTAYIMITNAEQTVGGAAFKLTMDPRIQLLNATFPAGVQIGQLTDGTQIGFTDCYAGFFGNPVLCATLTLWTGMNLLSNAELRIDPYPMTGIVQIANCLGELRTVGGGVATLTIPVGVETDSWGGVKSLYGN